MDVDLRRLVLGRDLADGQVEPAEARGFRRVHVAGRSYPMLLPHASGRVAGLLAHDIDAASVRRLTFYEGPEYCLIPIPAIDHHGHLRTAAVFLADRSIQPDERPWNLAMWQRRHKRSFLRSAVELMDGYGTRALLRQFRAMPRG